MQFDDRGLIPAIVQHARSGEVLMLGYMNEAALQRTIESGLVTFWSRSRQSIWQKAAQMLGNSTLCVLTELPVGTVRGDPDLKKIAEKAGEEGRAIAAALGVEVDAVEFVHLLSRSRSAYRPRFA